MKLELLKGRPENCADRLEKEVRTYDLLDSLGISYERTDHRDQPATSMAACAEIDAVLQITICKNLFLCNRQKTDFYLLSMPGDKPFHTKDLSAQLGIARLSFAPEDYMEQFLDITPGSVSILGLMNDKENRVRLLLDEEILQMEYFGCHPCINTSSMRIRTEDILERFLPAVHHDYTVVRLPR